MKRIFTKVRGIMVLLVFIITSLTSLAQDKAQFDPVATVSQSNLQLTVPGWYQSIAVTSQHLLIHDGVGFDATNAVRVYDRITGAFIKSIPTPTTVTGQVCTDADENFIVTRINQYGAGFMVYLYEGINDNAPDLILNWPDPVCPPNVGLKVSVLGSLKNGRAYIHATGDNGKVYRWEFNNGVVVDTAPVTIDPGFGSSWNFASAKWMTADVNSDMFITYHNASSGGSKIAVVSALGAVTEMPQSNHKFRVYDMQPFKLMGDDFLVITQQDNADAAPLSFNVFDVTNRTNMLLTPVAPDYNQFSIFQSPDRACLNLTHEGDVAVYVNGNEAFIYQSIVSSSTATNEDAAIVVYKMTYNDPLPVKLKEFKGRFVNEGVLLEWQTTSETNNDYFEVLHLKDGIEEVITTVNSKRNGNTVNYYSFLDKKSEVGTNYYQLRQVDKDGKSELSNIISVKRTNIPSVKAWFKSEKELQLQIDSETDDSLVLSVNDISGRKLFSGDLKLEKGNNEKTLSLKTPLSSGIYVLNFIKDSEATSLKIKND